MADARDAADDGRLLAGAMSGTSADGVDIAIVRVRGRGLGMTCELLHHHARPYDAALRERIFMIRGNGAGTLSDLAQLARDVSLVYAAAVNDALRAAGLSATDLAAVAAHGQTLFHDPPNTIQWLDPALIAAEAGCAVVSDFRRADCAAGGQGAPLVPFADYVLFRDAAKSRVLLNLGGIANITYLAAGGGIEEVLAFDTGPGNCVSDWLCRTREPNGPGYDVGGKLAVSGTAHFQVAFMAARDPYMFRKPPKSTDGPAMIAAYEAAKTRFGFSGSLADEVATACEFSVNALVMSLDVHVPTWRDGGVHEVLVSGGGVRNGFLMGLLRGVLEPAGVRVVELDAVIAQAKEAIAFALLGAATLDGEPSNVPSATGARRAVVLGSVTPRP